ncbi:hypothetical protein EMPS_07701 [Entomortierella parvispora]|uniref:Uncharacterized protein n=1 Tax=Entomortierella parvispora TaxID=205924 RepID=A0A9P3HF18_9FUNG|nr:hypothetical protein EMPS_07701 [Entomortierella parvispora]
MNLKTTVGALLALASTAYAQALTFDPLPGGATTDTATSVHPSTVSTALPTTTLPITSTQVSTAAPTTTIAPVITSVHTTTVAVTTATTISTTTSIAPLPTNQSASDSNTGTNSQLKVTGIIVGSVVVAAAIGIWVFRKWKLSPSRDFQSKIRGDDYTDYPRGYENDSVHLRNMESPSDPTPIKSPYGVSSAASGAVTAGADDQYYDAGYASKDQTGGYGHQGYAGDYGHAGYDQHYDNYNDQGGYGAGHHDGYGGSQVGGGGYGHGDYAASQLGGGYAPSQVGGGAYGQGGYAQSNVGGGYQHGGY